MSDLDQELARRLERLSAAVPARAGQLDPVHVGAVAARQRVRMAWLTPLIALVVLAVIVGLVGVGPLNVLNGPISATTRVGDFVLTVRSARATYGAGDPIDVSATLTYDGPKATVQIAHALGGPLGFGITEPVHGFHLGPAWRLSCNLGSLTRDVPLAEPFAKSGGSTGDQPGFEAFMKDRTLTLPAGTWHPYAVAAFALDECGGAAVDMRVDLTIEVVDRPAPTDAATPSSSPPTENAAETASAAPMPDGSDSAPPSPTNEPLQASTMSRNFELAVFAPTSTFAADLDIDITVRLSYLGADEWTWIGYGAPGLLTYSIVGIRGDDPLLTMECHQRQLHRDIPEVAKLADLQGGPRPLRLSSGRYQINVIALLDQGGCARDPLRLETTVEIAVTEGPNDIPLWTDPSRADHCELRANTGTLVRDPEGGLTVDLGSGIQRTIWPSGYSGTLVDGVAELFGADGSVVAREGDVIRFGGGFADIGPIRPCGEIEVLDPDSTGWLPPR